MQNRTAIHSRQLLMFLAMELLPLLMTIGCGGSASSSTTTTVIPPPAPTPNLVISVSHAGNFQLGQQGAVYMIAVKNNGLGDTDGASVTVTESLPTGMTLTSLVGAGWSCQSNTCTRNDVLHAGASYPAITATVNVGVDTALASVNMVSVSGGDSQSASSSDPTAIDPGPPSTLSVTMTHVGAFSAGQDFAPYTVVVSNASNAQAATIGPVSIQEVFPPGESASLWGNPSGTDGTTDGWNCPDNASCTRSDPLPPGKSYPPITLFVRVGPNASSPQVNTVRVSAPNSATASTVDSTVIGGHDACLSWPSGNESLMNGQYAMVAQGWQGKANATPVAMAFSVALDGQGKITDLGGGKGGDLDLNSVATGAQHFAINSTGSYYTVGPGQGCLRLETSGGPFTFAFFPRAISSGTAATAAVLQINDESGANSSLSGQIRIQDATAFDLGTTSALHGNYAFGEHGQSATGRFATAGSLILDPPSGAITSFTADQSSAGSLASVSGTGSVGPVSSMDGRATLTTQAAGEMSSQVVYILNANEFFVLSADSFNSTNAIRSGMAVVSSGSYVAGAIAGTQIIHTTGQIACTVNSSTLCATAELGLLNFSATSSSGGTLTASLFQYDIQNGPNNSSINSANPAAYAVAASTGRVTLANFGANAPVFYLASPAANTDPTTFFIVGTDKAASYGYGEPGAAQAVTVESLAGDYSIANDDLGDGSVWAQIMAGTINLNAVSPGFFFADDLSYTVGGNQWLQTMDINGDYDSTVVISNLDPNNNPAPGVGKVGLGLIAITNGHRILCLVQGTQLNKTTPIATSSAAVILIAELK